MEMIGNGPLIEIEGGEYAGDKYLFPISMKLTGSRGLMFNSHVLWSNVVERQFRTGVFEIREEDKIVRGFVNPDVKDYDVYCKFDIDKHKAKYIDYLEVIILEDGTVEYAVPSHQMKLVEVATKKLGKTREEISEMCPRERYADYNEWLCEISDSICVWHWFHMGKCNQVQKDTLQKLKDYGLYTGEIHTKEEK